MSLSGEKMKEELSDNQAQIIAQSTVPHVDFSFQFNTAKEYAKVEKKIFEYICQVSQDCFENKTNKGLLIVLGIFDNSKEHVITGMRQIGKNPIQKYLNVTTAAHKKEIMPIMLENYDGAFIVNRNGQLLGVGIYLTVDNPNLDIPDGSGTRHITAASFSTEQHVQAIFTLSEETNTVRVWKNGTFVEQFNPLEEQEVDPDDEGDYDEK